MLQVAITGLTIGLISGFHCVGMCGPIAFSLPVQSLTTLQRSLAVLLYNAGRIFTYVLLGILFGVSGRLVYLAGYQQLLSITVGSIFTLVALGYFTKNKTLQKPIFKKIQNKLWLLSDKLFTSKKLYTHFVIGNLNGLLPCGMVYFAASAALATGSLKMGAFLMLFFGLGTLPLMMLIGQFGFFLSLTIRNKIKRTVPYFVMIMGILLIVRGLNLGIPYLSPHFSNTAAAAISCH